MDVRGPIDNAHAASTDAFAENIPPNSSPRLLIEAHA
jgi:hypothetical protein